YEIHQCAELWRRNSHFIADLVREPAAGFVAVLRRREQRTEEEHETVWIMVLAHRLPHQFFGVPADLAHSALAIETETIAARDLEFDDCGAHVIHREAVVEQPHERPDRARRIIVLGFAQEQGASALE